MHPLSHARSSQNLHGGDIETWLPVHRWFDESKSQLAFFTHRALRHHLEGIEVAKVKFGNDINGVEVSVLGRQHLNEDCQKISRASDWLEAMKMPSWIPEEVNIQNIVEIEARLWKVSPDRIMVLMDWLNETSTWFDDARHMAMRHHSFGIFEAEDVFGVYLQCGDIKIPTRTLMENFVRRRLGRIPTASDWLRGIKGEKWMVNPPRNT